MAAGLAASGLAAGLAASGLAAGFDGVDVVFFAAATGFLAAGDLAAAFDATAAVAAAATPMAVPVTIKAGASEPIVAESETGLSKSRGSTVSCVLLTSTYRRKETEMYLT